ncbi:hypothetical protein GCM10010250_67150 [Streptomyces althioticus]|nr:hypothetical protein GCM10010250_67150 [Streptomyces althioticus]
MAGVGFASSYDTLRAAAEAKGFSHALSYWVPIGIDGAILAFLALDLYLTHRRIPKPLLRFAAHAMTLATVVLNATSGGKSGTGLSEDPVRALWHGLMPILFVVGWRRCATWSCTPRRSRTARLPSGSPCTAGCWPPPRPRACTGACGWRACAPTTRGSRGSRRWRATASGSPRS